MSLILERYILENANTQWDMFTKLRIIEMYSLIYGSMPAIVTYQTREDYVGPDLELIHPRNLRIQSNKSSIEDADYCFVNSVVPVSFLKNKLKEEKTIYDKDAIKELLSAIEYGTPDREYADKTWEERQREENKDTGKSTIILSGSSIPDVWINFSYTLPKSSFLPFA